MRCFLHRSITTKILVCLAAFLLVPCLELVAQEHLWAFESLDAGELRQSGNVSVKAGVKGSCIVSDGRSLMTVKESQRYADANVGFTITAWVNPYLKSRQSQMLVCKNQYSLDQREWGIMIDIDHRFRLYLWQGKWVTVDSDFEPYLGNGIWSALLCVQPVQTFGWTGG